MGVSVREVLDEVANDCADGIIGGSDGEQDLNGTGVILFEPGAEASFREGVGAFEGFEEGDAGVEIGGGESTVQGKTAGSEPLPEEEEEAEEGQSPEDAV